MSRFFKPGEIETKETPKSANPTNEHKPLINFTLQKHLAPLSSHQKKIDTTQNPNTALKVLKELNLMANPNNQQTEAINGVLEKYTEQRSRTATVIVPPPDLQEMVTKNRSNSVTIGAMTTVIKSSPVVNTTQEETTNITILPPTKIEKLAYKAEEIISSLEDLKKSTVTNIKQLSLDEINLSDLKNLQEVFNFITNHSELEHISLSHCQLNDSNVKPLLKAMESCRKLSYLNLSHNKIQDLLPLRALLKTNPITKLHLNHNSINEFGAKDIFSTLENIDVAKRLEVLNLSDNKLFNAKYKETSWLRFVYEILSTNFKQFNTEYNEINKKYTNVSGALQKHALTTLALNNVGLNRDALYDLIDVLDRFERLESLAIDKNHFTVNDISTLEASLKNRNIEKTKVVTLSALEQTETPKPEKPTEPEVRTFVSFKI